MQKAPDTFLRLRLMMFRTLCHGLEVPSQARGHRRAFNSGGNMIIPLVLINDYQDSALPDVESSELRELEASHVFCPDGR